MTAVIPLLAALAASAAYGFFIYWRLLRYLHLYQQDDYDVSRFLSWLVKSRSIDVRLSLTLLVIGTASLLIGMRRFDWAFNLASGAVLLSFGLFEPNPRKNAKKILVLTRRASLIAWTAFSLAFVTGVVANILAPVWGFILGLQLVPFWIVAANFLLRPVEQRSRQYYWNEASARLRAVNPTVVGVTGSFGKTSVKHILGHVLELNASTLITPGSVNTPMGVAQVVRERMQSDCRYFVVEMGAYGPGSIARLCQLTPPNFGIITAIGEAHYERFRSLDAVTRAKFELGSAVLEQSAKGRLIVHSDVLRQLHASEFVAKYRARVIVCGEGQDVDVAIRSWEQTADGLAVTLSWRGTDYRIIAPIYGAQQVGNLLLAFAAAVSVGISPERIVSAMRTTPQIKSRLFVKRQASGPIYIDDSYNSNPVGFAAGLQLLSQLATSGGRRILVTPGMVELGEKHAALHRQLGMHAADQADFVIVVRPERIPTFVEGFESKRSGGNLIFVETFAKAREWLESNVRDRDVVLIENDLPDLHEAEFRL